MDPVKIKKLLPNMITNRFSKVSCPEKVFNNEANTYQDALNETGFPEKLNYTDSASSAIRRKPDLKERHWVQSTF